MKPAFNARKKPPASTHLGSLSIIVDSATRGMDGAGGLATKLRRQETPPALLP
jgi:hypothetical protein